MKLKKKTVMIMSLAIGTIMFATTAMAEIKAKSGYEQLKDALKYTADSCTSSSKLSNYTMELSFYVKDNGNVVSSSEGTNKYDLLKSARENTTNGFDGKNKANSYYYSDKTCSVSHDYDQNVYYVNQYSDNNQNEFVRNPFKEKEASDIEKIADALVGNLKDSVVVKQNEDGSKELSGSLTEAQIPAIVNAVISFQVKKRFGAFDSSDRQNTMSKITKDIFVKEVKGNMTVDKNGMMQNLLGTGTLSGKEDDGTEHTLSFEILCKITDINKTAVNKPDLTGKKVEKSTVQSDKLTNPDKFIGTYKNNIIIEKDGKFEKIGERVLKIAHIDDKNVSGSYSEEYQKGYEEYAADKKTFNFDAKFNNNDKLSAEFDYKTSSGKATTGSIYLDQWSAKVNFSIPEQTRAVLDNGEFNRVFD